MTSQWWKSQNTPRSRGFEHSTQVSSLHVSTLFSEPWARHPCLWPPRSLWPSFPLVFNHCGSPKAANTNHKWGLKQHKITLSLFLGASNLNSRCQEDHEGGSTSLPLWWVSGSATVSSCSWQSVSAPAVSLCVFISSLLIQVPVRAPGPSYSNMTSS